MYNADCVTCHEQCKLFSCSLIKLGFGYYETLLVCVKNEECVKVYISTCIRLALLMTANDPPVVIECPGWQMFSKRQHPRETASLSSSDDGPAPEDLNNDNVHLQK